VLTRQKEFLQWLAGGFTTSALIVGGVWIAEHHDVVIAQIMRSSGSMSFASTSSESSTPVEPTKLEILNGQTEASLKPERKASGNMQITLTSNEGRKPDGSLALEAYVTAVGALNDLKYEWVLPDGAILSSGSLSGTFGNVSEGSQVSTALVLNVPVTNEHVVFHAYREMAGEKVGQIAHYNTVEQKTIDMNLALKRESLQRKPASNARRFE
jgi:hypothetical protein